MPPQENSTNNSSQDLPTPVIPTPTEPVAPASVPVPPAPAPTPSVVTPPTASGLPTLNVTPSSPLSAVMTGSVPTAPASPAAETPAPVAAAPAAAISTPAPTSVQTPAASSLPTLETPPTTASLPATPVAAPASEPASVAPASEPAPAVPFASVPAPAPDPFPPTAATAPMLGVSTPAAPAPVLPDLSAPPTASVQTPLFSGGGVIPSVAPTAPGAEPKPVTPIADPPTATDKQGKKSTGKVMTRDAAAASNGSNVVMVVLVVILVLLMAVAGVLWYFNSQGRSLFAPAATPVNEPELDVALTTISSASGEALTANTDDACYVDPDPNGDASAVQDFVTWAQGTFTDVDDPTGEYQQWFDYFVDRRARAAGACSDHQYYCQRTYKDTPAFIAQFAQANYQRDLEAAGVDTSSVTRIPTSALREELMIDFDVSDFDFSDPTLERGSLSANGLAYDATTDTIAAFGDDLEPATYTYRFLKASALPLEGLVLLTGESVAGADCVESAGCQCQASRIYIVMEQSATGDYYFKNEFVEPLVGTPAAIN